jgi:hypothetical protein
MEILKGIHAVLSLAHNSILWASKRMFCQSVLGRVATTSTHPQIPGK